MRRLCILALLFTTNTLTAQTIIQRDTEIEKMVKEISADSYRSARVFIALPM